MSLWSCCPACCQLEKVQVVEVEGVATAEEDEGVKRLRVAAKDGDATMVKTCIKHGVDVNAPDPDGTPRSRNATPLIYAARAGHTEVVDLLLKVPEVDVNATTEDTVRNARSQQTALHWATRENYGEVVSMLLDHPGVDPNAKTKFGFTACMLAGQGGAAEVLKVLVKDPRVDLRHYILTPEKVELSSLMVSIIEGNEESVEVLANTKRKDAPDLQALYKSIAKSRQTYLAFACETQHPGIVHSLLTAKADPDIPDENGLTPIKQALEANATEILMLLLLSGVDTKEVFSPVREAQVLADAPALQKLNEEGKVATTDQLILPPLHRHVITNDINACSEEATKLGKEASTLVDGGNMPAAFWAIELGHWEQARKLLIVGHGMPEAFVDSLLNGDFGKVNKEPAKQSGDRIFEVFMALLAERADITNQTALAKGAFSLLKPFCGSVAALKYFSARPKDFDDLREACKEVCSRIFSRIDRKVTYPVLQDLAQVAKGENTQGVRQDMPGLVPPLKYFLSEESAMTMGGNHELFSAMGLAMIGFSINDIFVEDMKALLSEYAEVVEAPSKTFGRMFNKLLNKAEHGDPSIPKPRPMKNVDIDRVGAIIAEPANLDRAYKALKAKYKILRYKNNHNPEGGEGFGGYRNLLINFSYTSGLTYKEVFGTGSYNHHASDAVIAHEAHDDVAKMWLRLCNERKPANDWRWALQGLWRVARLEPDREVVLGSEVQMILAEYMTGRHMSHLLYKISRCETGPREMARDFAGGFQVQTAEMKKMETEAAAYAGKVRMAKKGK